MKHNTCIVICGEKYDIGTRVVLWYETNGLNAYDTTSYTHWEEDRKTGKTRKRVVSGKRYSRRFKLPRARTLKNLRKIVSQFFLHHDGMYRSADTFRVLHVERGLSCHFLLDDDGTIYQTMDLFDKAWHGGKCNSVSVGVEIASRARAGKYPTAYSAIRQKRYGVGPRKKRFDVINGVKMLGYGYNDKQYKALAKLAGAMVDIFPMIKPTFPMNNATVVKKTMANLRKHKGFICHFHVSRSKVDPIAFEYTRFIEMVTGGPTALFDFQGGKSLDPLDTWMDRQNALIAMGYNPGNLDGVFGPKTKLAIKRFQSDSGLVPDGVWGPKTRKAVMERLCLE